MIQLKNITLRNFLSIGQVTQAVNFDSKELTLILGENLDLGGDGARNGTGKTTLIQGLSYVLFGTPINQIRKDNLLGAVKQMAYNKAPQPVTDDSKVGVQGKFNKNFGKDAGKKATKILNQLESTQEKNNILNRIKNVIDTYDMVLFASSMTTNVLIDELHKDYGRSKFLIDIGSLFDIFYYYKNKN